MYIQLLYVVNVTLYILYLATYVCTGLIETWHCKVAYINDLLVNISMWIALFKVKLEVYANKAPRESCADQ